ncbi:MAG: CHAT domain-containing protein, partial [Blastocatellia bacterium]
NEDGERRLKHLGLESDMQLNLNIENPLLRSGLGLAGANLQKSGDDDGILTAQEAAGLDLWGTKLVVLSACDTGVGEVKNGEGVYGLRRALVLAGSETQVMSLWPVSDLGTRDLMIGYYKRLLAGQGRTEALRNNQLQMLRSGGQVSDSTNRILVTKGQNIAAKDGVKKDRSHPYYWASFIQSGEWANLDGKR